MAYQNGVANNPTDLLQKLSAFLQAQGWTANMAQAEGNGYRLHVSKGAQFVALKSTTNIDADWPFPYAHGGFGALGYACVFITGCTGFDGSKTWINQPGVPLTVSSSVGAQINPMHTGLVSALVVPGAITQYHFFTDSSGQNVAVVIEKTPGVFTHFGWGQVTKSGAWNGGAYIHGANSPWNLAPANSPQGRPWGVDVSAMPPMAPSDDPSTYGGSTGFILGDVDSTVGGWLSVGTSLQNATNQTARVVYPSMGLPGSAQSGGNNPTNSIPHTQQLQERATNALNSQVNLVPVHLYVPRDSGGFSLLGALPGVFYCTAFGSGYPSGAEIQIGPDTYKTFPYFAVKKVA